MTPSERLERTLIILTILFIMNTIMYIVLVNIGNNHHYWILLSYSNYGVLLACMSVTTVRLASARQSRQKPQQQADRNNIVVIVDRQRPIIQSGFQANRASLQPPAYSPPGHEPPPPYLQMVPLRTHQLGATHSETTRQSGASHNETTRQSGASYSETAQQLQVPLIHQRTAEQ